MASEEVKEYPVLLEDDDSEEQLTVEIPPEAIDLTDAGDGGVMKVVKKEGTGTANPMKGDKVFVHYVGTLPDGTQFDSSRERNHQFEFTLGKGEVIKAWDIGVASMKQLEMCTLYCKPEYAYGKSGSPPKIPPNCTLIFEVELFDWKGDDLSDAKDGGVIRSIIEEGKGYGKIDDGARVEVHLVGMYNDAVFEERDVSFDLGDGIDFGVVPGVEMALKHFKKGEKSQLRIAPAYGFGNDGKAEFNIPPGAQLVYDVVLKRYEKEKEAWQLDKYEKLTQGELVKQKGTDYYKRGRFYQATTRYKKVIDYLESETTYDEEKKQTQRDGLMLAAHLNLSLCYLKLEDFNNAVEHCNKALQMDRRNEKAFYRRATARMNLYDYDPAIADFLHVIEISPDNKAARTQIAICQQRTRQALAKEKQMYSGMFQKFAKQDALPQKKTTTTAEEDSSTSSEQEKKEEEVGKGDEQKQDSKDTDLKKTLETMNGETDPTEPIST